MEITAVLSPAPPSALACKQRRRVLPWSWCTEEWEQQQEAEGHTGLPEGEGRRHHFIKAKYSSGAARTYVYCIVISHGAVPVG